MSEMYDQGFACGMNELDWPCVAAGRFLRAWERAELAAGWKVGLAERAAYERDQMSGVAAAAWDAAPW